jgi:AcrR family transcriptional regulator
MSQTLRSRNKDTRRAQLLTAAASLFAERGFANVTLEELGSAVGISGPAVYRHFPSKDAVLAELLIEVSNRLIDGAEAAVADSNSNQGALESLIAFQTDFALRNRNVIWIQRRDLTHLERSDAQIVRALQRNFINLWIGVLTGLQPDLTPSLARTKVQATLAMINSTPFSTPKTGAFEESRSLLEKMAKAALFSAAGRVSKR